MYHIYQIYDQHLFSPVIQHVTHGESLIVHKIKHVVHMYFPEKLSNVKVDQWRGRRVGPNMQGLILG